MAWTMLSGPLLVAIASQVLCLAQAAGIRGCPTPTKGLRSEDHSNDDVELKFTTKSEESLSLYHVDHLGTEHRVGTFGGMEGLGENTHPGHAFRVYTRGERGQDRVLLLEYRVQKDREQNVSVNLRPECLSEANRAKHAAKGGFESRAEELEALVVSGWQGEMGPCEPEGQSHLWSCVRRVPKSDCDARHRNESRFTEGNSFGFAKKQGRWWVGAYEDEQFNWQIPKIPKLSSGPGFLLMNMTDKIRQGLLPWFDDRWSKQAGVFVESPVPGGYLNDAWVPSSLVGTTRSVEALVEAEMRDVLEWWTNMELRHSATFGVRVYHRGAVLLNHVDRYDTHLASAVMQVHQEVDQDAGWPVEVLSEEQDCYEIYLQPGQMVLYEGAHFKHGRPMAFRGKDFGNLFVHFAPKDWHGPQLKEL